MKYVGVDGCKRGWFAVWFTNNKWGLGLFKSIASLWKKHKDASLILIDIPIGLRDDDSKGRLCDIEARKLLGPKRGSSIFPTPTRAATYGEIKYASDINQEKTGKRLSEQTLGIIPKIREIDGFLLNNRSARLCIKEIHPEICFWALAGGRPMKYQKKTIEGLGERRRVLRKFYSDVNSIIECALSTYRRKEVTEDDILDALSAAVTATFGLRGLMLIPKTPEFDSRGLRMEMLYHLR